MLRNFSMNSLSAADAVGLTGIASRPVVGSLAKSVGVGTSGGVTAGSKRAVTTSSGAVESTVGVQANHTRPNIAHNPKYLMWNPRRKPDGDCDPTSGGASENIFLPAINVTAPLEGRRLHL